MARADLQATPASLIAQNKFTAHWRPKIANGSGTLKDLSYRLRGISGTQPGPGQPIAVCTLELLREVSASPALSLAPLIANTINQDDVGAYSPLVEYGRLVTVDLAYTALGAARPADGSNLWDEVFRGYITGREWAGPFGATAVTVQCNDSNGWLQLAKSTTAYTYAAGTSIEVAIQQCLNNNGWGSIVVYCPIATGKVLTATYAPGIQKPVFQQIWEMAQSIGWVIWTRYTDVGTVGTPRLWLFEPKRTSVTSEFTHKVLGTPSSFGGNDSEITNDIRGEFTNLAGARETPTPVTDPVSIAKYGGVPRTGWLIEPPDSVIRSAASWTAMATAALPDLAEPDAVASYPVPLWLHGEVSVDRYTFLEDDLHYDTAQVLAPYQISYGHRAGSLPRSDIQVRGKATAGSGAWRTRLGTTRAIATLRTYVDTAFHDGVISESEALAIEEHLKALAAEKADMDARYTATDSSVRLPTAVKSTLTGAKNTYNSAYTSVVGAINTAIADGLISPTDRTNVASAFTTYGSALASLAAWLEEATKALAASFDSKRIVFESFEVVPVGFTTFSGTTTIEPVTGTSGGKVLQVTGYVEYRPAGSRMLPFDPTRLYRVSVRIRKLVEDAGANDYLYAGAEIFDAAGSSLGVQYCTFTGEYITVAQGWVTRTGWLKGTGAAVQPATNPKNPSGVALAATAFIAPYMLVNYPSGTSTHQVDDFAIEAVDQEIFDAAWALEDFTNTAFTDGIISRAEAQAFEEHLKALASDDADIDNRYNTLAANPRLTGTAWSNLVTAKTNYESTYAALVSAINTAIADGLISPTDRTNVATAFTNYGSNIGNLSIRFKEADNAIAASYQTVMRETVGNNSLQLVPVPGALFDLVEFSVREGTTGWGSWFTVTTPWFVNISLVDKHTGGIKYRVWYNSVIVQENVVDGYDINDAADIISEHVTTNGAGLASFLVTGDPDSDTGSNQGRWSPNSGAGPYTLFNLDANRFGGYTIAQSPTNTWVYVQLKNTAGVWGPERRLDIPAWEVVPPKVGVTCLVDPSNPYILWLTIDALDVKLRVIEIRWAFYRQGDYVDGWSNIWTSVTGTEGANTVLQRVRSFNIEDGKDYDVRYYVKYVDEAGSHISLTDTIHHAQLRGLDKEYDFPFDNFMPRHPATTTGIYQDDFLDIPTQGLIEQFTCPVLLAKGVVIKSIQGWFWLHAGIFATMILYLYRRPIGNGSATTIASLTVAPGINNWETPSTSLAETVGDNHYGIALWVTNHAGPAYFQKARLVCGVPAYSKTW